MTYYEFYFVFIAGLSLGIFSGMMLMFIIRLIRQRLPNRIMCKVVANVQGTYRLIGEKTIKISEKSFKYKDFEYIVDTKFSSYMNKNNRPIIFYKKENANPFYLTELLKKDNKGFDIVPSELLEDFMSTSLFGKLLNWQKEKLFVILVIVLVCVILAIAGISFFVIWDLNNKMLQATSGGVIVVP